jgi:transcription termination factor Rho
MHFEEFEGTSNIELLLDRKLVHRHAFPAIDINKFGDRQRTSFRMISASTDDILLPPRKCKLL